MKVICKVISKIDFREFGQLVFFICSFVFRIFYIFFGHPY
jgi:hypothetical protein